MKMLLSNALCAAGLLIPLTLGTSSADRPDKAKPDPAPAKGMSDRSGVEKVLAAWSPRPVLAARQMIAKYGLPQDVTSEKLVWRDQGPYKRIVVTRVEDPHDFPKPHMDYLEHTIAYRVPAAKATALLTYDGSVTLDRTVGEMSARCDLEGHNILTLNLAHDIVTGKKNVKAARTAFGKIVGQDMRGEKPAYVMALQFDPKSRAGADPDVAVIPGSPKRGTAGAMANEMMGDAEVLGFLVAINENEILAAAEAEMKKPRAEVLAYAAMLQKEHAMNDEQTMMLGKKIKIQPVETTAVDNLRVKGAKELGMLVPLAADEFATAYIAAMVKGHAEVLEMIDNKLMPAAKNAGIKAHLTKTRGQIAKHLEEAKRIQAGLRNNQVSSKP
ncbi:MAG: DUF4142 domain-containing protein [Myxococcota bacterium]|nr:DUF4142 domain-containing protein [Myxococcota bacterium]